MLSVAQLVTPVAQTAKVPSPTSSLFPALCPPLLVLSTVLLANLRRRGFKLPFTRVKADIWVLSSVLFF